MLVSAGTLTSNNIKTVNSNVHYFFILSMLYHKLLFFVKISIHAPAKGSTKKFGTVEYAKEISIHAPARGATNAWRTFNYEM